MKLPEEIKNLNNLAYITRRKLENENGEQIGAVVMWRTKGEEVSNYLLQSPHCGVEHNLTFSSRRGRTDCSVTIVRGAF